MIRRYHVRIQSNVVAGEAKRILKKIVNSKSSKFYRTFAGCTSPFTYCVYFLNCPSERSNGAIGVFRQIFGFTSCRLRSLLGTVLLQFYEYGFCGIERWFMPYSIEDTVCFARDGKLYYCIVIILL